MNRRRPFVIGLTGSIGMGKTTTAEMFADQGIPVWNADAAVHRLYDVGGAAVIPLKEVHQQAVVDEKIDRSAVKKWITEDPEALRQIESVVHPLVAADRTEFLSKAKQPVVVLDVPLLFETGNVADYDLIVVVSVPEDVQRQRVLARPGMTENQFKTILDRQMPDIEKQNRADVVIQTLTLDGARQAVQNLLKQVRKKFDNA